MMRAQPIGNGLLTARVPEHVAALLAALQFQGANSDQLLSLDDVGWQKVLTCCDQLRLTLPLALRICRESPLWVSDRLTRNLSHVAERFPRVQATYREIAAVLAQAGVPHLVLKGFTQSPDFVKAPQFRMQGDIDFYAPPRHVQAAIEALQSIGYEPAGPPDEYLDADHPPTLVRFGGWKWRENLFDPEMPLAVEAHTCLWNASVSLIPLPEVEAFWNRRITRRLGELSFCSLDPIDHLCYFALHVVRDIFQTGRIIHHAFELATFLHQRADDRAFWSEWDARYSPRLKQVQAVALALAGAGFSSRLSTVVENQIHGLPAELRSWLESCGGNLLAVAFHRTRDGRLLQFLLSDTPGARRRALWRAVAPGAIPHPRQIASRTGGPGAPQTSQRTRLRKYLAFLASRTILNGAAVLRFLAIGLFVFLPVLAGRREARSQ